MLQGRLEQMGFSFYLKGQSEEIIGKDKVEGLRLKDGRTIEGQMVIISAGVRPNKKIDKKRARRTDSVRRALWGKRG